MGMFGSKEPKVQIVEQGVGKRVLSLYDFVEDKNAAKAYARKYAHVAPNRLEFMDRVSLWEGVYISMRLDQGWMWIKGGRLDGDRFKIEWQVGEDVIVAEQDDWDGTILERLKKKKK